jgi:acyl-coenzyme A thioesterase PaaI-like protein
MTETHEEVIRQREAVANLGSALREVIVAQAANEVSPENLAEAARLARRITSLVSGNVRELSQVASVDSLPDAIRYFSPVTGLGNPMSPPLVFAYEGESVVVRTTLDRRFEGPPGFVHGGVTSLLLDEVLGQAGTQAGRWGMTAFLNVTYRHALPLDTELELTSHIDWTEGRKTHVRGAIALASDPSVPHVEAEALFIEPRQEKQERYFGDLRDLGGVPQSGRHGGTSPLRV